MTQDLDHDLDRFAGHFDLPRGDIGEVVERANRRSHRRRRGLVALTTVVAVGVTATGVNLINHGHSGTRIRSGAAPAAAHLSWHREQPGTALGYASDPSGNGPLYALSTAPGTATIDPVHRNVVYRSADGVEWASAATVGNDLYLSDLAGNDSRVYAVGTGPASASVGGANANSTNLLVGWSDDQAKSWAKHTLPVDLAAISSKASRVSVAQSNVAVGAHGVVISALVNAELDVPALLPSGVTAPKGWAITSTGVDVLGDGPLCPSGTTELPPGKDGGNPSVGVPPSEPGASTTAPASLPADPKARDEAQRRLASKANANASPSRVGYHQCFATDGTAHIVTPQESQGVAHSYSWAQLGVDGDLLRAVLGQPFVFAANAGSTDFQPVSTPELSGVNSMTVQASDQGFDLVASVGSDGMTAPAKGGSKLVALHSPDGQTWAQSGSTPQGLDWINTVGRVDGRIVVVGSGPDGAMLLVDNASGGWTSTKLADVLQPAAAANDHVEVVDAAVGPLGVAVTVNVFSLADKVGGGTSESRVLVSRDAVAWSDDGLNALAGTTVTPQRVDMVGDHVVVSAYLPSDAGKPLQQIALVGTPQ